MERPSNVLSHIQELLGLGNRGTLSRAGQTLELLQRCTRDRLLACARLLGFEGLHRLTKDAIVSRLEPVLRGLGMLDDEEPPRVDPGVHRDAHPAKFDLGPAREREPVPQDVPWSYGRDRVTAMVVDPDRLYVYWEVTDDAIARARDGLGAGGRDAWPVLRVYDVSGRIFDGTNAHGYFDQKIERSDRQWFFQIGKPSSAACVEIGMQSTEGYFVRVARSGRVDFPRREPSPASEVEWLTVETASGPVESRDAGSPGRGEIAADGGEAASQAQAGPGEPASPAGGSRREVATGEWLEGPVLTTTWEAGPFPFPIGSPEYVEEHYSGEVAVYEHGTGTRVVYGPWQVIIRGLGARAERRVLATWEIRRTWIVGADAGPRPRTGGILPGGSERLGGASEQGWAAASELRLRGASELHLIGASELRFRGASEVVLGGASEWRAPGASERRQAGGSELLVPPLHEH